MFQLFKAYVEETRLRLRVITDHADHLSVCLTLCRPTRPSLNMNRHNSNSHEGVKYLAMAIIISEL